MPETLTARITRVLYCKPSRGASGVNFLIAATDKGVTVKGEMSKPVEGQEYRFDGEYRFDVKYNAQNFIFDFFEPVVDASIDGIATFLSSHIDGLGPVKAQAITEALGEETLKILRTTPEALLKIAGINEKIVANIKTYFEENPEIDPASYARLVDLFREQKFPKRLITQLLKDFGSSAPDVVVENPYLLLAYPRMGWKSVDGFAVTAAGYDVNGIERQKAAILEAINRVVLEGHTYSTRGEIDAGVVGMLNRTPCARAWVELAGTGEIVLQAAAVGQSFLEALTEDLEEGNEIPEPIINRVFAAPAFDVQSPVSIPRLDQAERDIAYHLYRIAAHARPLSVQIDTEGLNEDQIRAVTMLSEHGVCLLVGAPGTGKSYTVSRVTKSICYKHTVRFVAPTGKAAKRSEELVSAALGSQMRRFDIPCTTIHRALGPVPSKAATGVPDGSAKVNRGREGFTFKHSEEDPLNVSVLFVDEASMIDVRLASDLLAAVPNGARLVIVGDPNQLPSVGPGSVLRDLLQAGLPSCELNRIVRSDGGGTVVKACHAVKDGRVPEATSAISLPTDNWIHLEVDDPDEITTTIVKLVESTARNGRFDPIWDVQVISPQRRSIGCSCGPLNQQLSELLNPRDTAEPIDTPERDDAFRIGDKVIRTKNGVADLMKQVVGGAHVDWRWQGESWSIDETDIVNGDMGIVRDIVKEKSTDHVVVAFRNPDRLCRLPLAGCELQQAYAVTVHKAQGSGFPYVIMPVHTGFFWDARRKIGLNCRELFYTGISRSEQVCVTVGQWAAVGAVVHRQTLHYRRTRLVSRVASYQEQVEKQVEVVV